MQQLESKARAESLVGSSLVVDAILPWAEYGSRSLRAETLPRFQRSGYNLVSLSLASDKEGPTTFLHFLAKIRREIAQDERLTLIESVADVRAAQEAGKLAISLNLQGTNNLGADLNLVEVWYRLGLRQMLLAYNKKNAVGDGCHERTDCGLSTFGVELVQEMNRVGMLVDCSHTGYRTSMEAMEVSTAPVVFSHSNPKALWDHQRNIRDDQAILCARKGGWIGVVGVDIFMKDNTPSSENFFRQIDYYCELIGSQHVGLGADFVYDHEDMREYMRSVKSPPSGNYENMTAYFQPEQLVDVVEHMVKAGYRDADIRGILGENYLRVASQVWR